jgi:hypothetical protein
MSVQERQANLLNEAKALIFFFGVSSDLLVAGLNYFDELYASTDPVSSDELVAVLDTIDREIEDLCIARKITQERLEELMENNFAFKSVVIE